jgi:hypothetical protein
LPQSTLRALNNQIAPASGFYRISGTVVNAVTGEPVRRATVSAQPVENSQTVESVESGNDGHFALERLPAAKYLLTASKRGFRTGFYDEHEGFNTAIVTGADQDTGGLVFRLMPEAVLYGVVTGDGGDPVEGASVMLFRKPHGHEPGGRIGQTGSAITDDTGFYEFDNLAEGEYLLAVKAEPWYALHPSAGRTRPDGDPSTSLDVAYPVTYYDSTTDEASATGIALARGSREDANINLHAVPAIHLLFPPQDPQDNTKPHPVQLSQPVFGELLPSQIALTTDATQPGAYELSGVAPGHYELEQGNPPRMIDLDATANQTIDPNLGTPFVALTGTLQTPSGAPLAGEAILTLKPADGAVLPRPMQTAISRGGSFSFESVPSGAWELLVTGSGKLLPVTSTTVDGKKRAGNQVTVGDGPLSIAVTVAAAETSVEGFARKDGRGKGGAMVVLVPGSQSASTGLFRRDQSDSDGSFSLRDVAPGRYTVVAIEGGWALDWSQPEVIGRYLKRGIAVTVTGDSGKVIHLSEPVPVQSR